MTTTKQFAVFDLLPAGVTAEVDQWVLKYESPEMLDLIARYAEAVLVEPLPPLKSVAVYYNTYMDSPFVISFNCEAPAAPFDEWYAWVKPLSQRAWQFEAGLSADEREALDCRLALSYSPGIPSGFAEEEPSWFREAKHWPKLCR